MPGTRLAELSARVDQTIEGDFQAFRTSEAQPWLVLKAIDGCYFVVVTADEELLCRLRRRFRDLRPSPDDAVLLI